MKRLLICLAIVGACTHADKQPRRDTFDAARLAMWRGDLAGAQTLVDRGIADAPPDSLGAWRLQLLRAEILLNRLDASQPLPQLTAAVPAGPEFDGVRARQKYLQSKAKAGQGQLAEALVSLDTAQQFLSSTTDEEELRLDAEILSGQIRLRTGQWEEGEKRLHAAVERAVRSGSRYHQALALNNLGMGRLVRGRYDEALTWFEEVLSRDDLKEMAVYATTLYNAGICYARLGRFDRALALQERALAVYDRGEPTLQLVQSLGTIGNSYFLQGDARKALPFLRRAFDVAVRAKFDAEAARWARNLSSAHAMASEWDEAERLNEEARRLAATTETGPPVLFTLNAAEIALGRGEFARAARLFDEVLAASRESASIRWSAHAGLARVAAATKQPERAGRHFEAALKTIEATRSSLLKTEFRLSFLTQLIEFYQAYVAALIDQGRIERALEIAESSRGRVLAELHGVQPEQTAGAAALRALARQSGTVLISYWLAPARSYAWIVTAQGVHGVALPAAPEIEKLVRDHQAAIDNSLGDPLGGGTPGDRLYAVLIAPVMQWIAAGAPVAIVPDGALHRLNFETLPVNAERRHYWIEDVEIQVAPSLAMLSRQPAATTAGRPLLLIGNPVPREPEFPALRYAPAEMKGVAKHFPAASVATYQRDRAAPAAFRAAKPEQFGIIHFTAHATANAESPLDSAVILSGSEHAYKLYARDVAEQRLQADLVTVSACRSAGERAYSGEGLVGFAWAFLRAGSRRVIAGLWDVDDRSTAELMEELYRRIASGEPPPRALREAKLSMLRRGGTTARPYYWGPFEVFTLVL